MKITGNYTDTSSSKVVIKYNNYNTVRTTIIIVKLNIRTVKLNSADYEQWDTADTCVPDRDHHRNLLLIKPESL